MITVDEIGVDEGTAQLGHAFIDKNFLGYV